MCDDSPLHRPARDRPRRANERLRENELTPFGPESAGVLCWPEGQRPAPVLIVAPERYGLVQHTVDVAARFARAGWVAVSPDFYLGVPDDAAARLPPVPDDTVLRHIRAGLAHLAPDPRADTSRVAVFGVCRSGSWGLLAAAENPNVRAVIMLYGGAAPKEWVLDGNRSRDYEDVIAASPAPVLGIYGERDHTMSVSDVARLRDAFERHRRSYDISIVKDVPHGWVNDTMPGRYDRDQAEQTWERMLAFLRRHLDPDSDALGVDDVEWRFMATTARDYDFASNVRLE